MIDFAAIKRALDGWATVTKDYALMKRIADRWQAEYERERKAKEESEDELEHRIAALRKALEEAKINRHDDDDNDGQGETCPAAFERGGACDCWMGRHDAAINRALEGGA